VTFTRKIGFSGFWEMKNNEKLIFTAFFIYKNRKAFNETFL